MQNISLKFRPKSTILMQANHVTITFRKFAQINPTSKVFQFIYPFNNKCIYFLSHMGAVNLL